MPGLINFSMFFRCLLPLRWGISPHDDRVFELYTARSTMG